MINSALMILSETEKFLKIKIFIKSMNYFEKSINGKKNYHDNYYL